MGRLGILLSAILLAASIKTGVAQLTATCYINQQPVSNVEIEVYKVGEAKGTSIVFDDKYIGISSPDIHSVSSIQSCTNSIMSRVNGSGYTPDYKGVLSDNGKLKIDDMPEGVYVLSAKPYQQSGKKYTLIPTMVFLYGDKQLDLKMEVEELPSTPSDDTTTLSVRKHWVIHNGGAIVPVTVGLFRDNVLVDSIELNKENNWEYTWYDLSVNSLWSVSELTIPENFIAELSKTGDTFVITNTSVEYLKLQIQTGVNSKSLGLGILCLGCTLMLIVTAIILKAKEQKK